MPNKTPLTLRLSSLAKIDAEPWPQFVDVTIPRYVDLENRLEAIASLNWDRERSSERQM